MLNDPTAEKAVEFEIAFLLVDISTSFGEVFYENVSLLRNRKFDLINQ